MNKHSVQGVVDTHTHTHTTRCDRLRLLPCRRPHLETIHCVYVHDSDNESVDRDRNELKLRAMRVTRKGVSRLTVQFVFPHPALTLSSLGICSSRRVSIFHIYLLSMTGPTYRSTDGPKKSANEPTNQRTNDRADPPPPPPRGAVRVWIPRRRSSKAYAAV